VAPSGPFDRALFEQGFDVMRAAGLVPRCRDDLHDRDRFLAGTDDRRLEELRAAIDAPDSDLVWCARGGYGATRLLPRLSREAIRRSRKLLVGFSDITALHARWLDAGLPSVHGMMMTRLATDPAEVRDRLFELLFTGRASPLSGQGLVPGVAHGRLSGGNLTVLAALCETPFQPRLDGSLLFLEDVGEKPYRLDRALVQCAQAGLFTGVRGVAVGEFTGCDDAGLSGAEVVHEHLRALGVPVLAGLPCGHGAVNHALPFGTEVRLDADAGLLEFLEPVHAEGVA
jgi:muramoyltetrapeptide carboxypeptidase